MKLTVKGKDLALGEALRQQTEETLTRLAEKFFGNPIDATVSFGRRAHDYSAHISLHVGRDLSSEASGEGRSAYEALFSAGESLEAQLRKLKEKRRRHPRREPDFSELEA